MQIFVLIDWGVENKMNNRQIMSNYANSRSTVNYIAIYGLKKRRKTTASNSIHSTLLDVRAYHYQISSTIKWLHYSFNEGYFDELLLIIVISYN